MTQSQARAVFLSRLGLVKGDGVCLVSGLWSYCRNEVARKVAFSIPNGMLEFQELKTRLLVDVTVVERA